MAGSDDVQWHTLCNTSPSQSIPCTEKTSQHFHIDNDFIGPQILAPQDEASHQEKPGAQGSM